MPRVPIVLLTAIKPMPPYFTPETMQAWGEMHQEFAKKMPGIQHVITDKSTLIIPVDQPELVVDAIRRESRVVSCHRSDAAI